MATQETDPAGDGAADYDYAGGEVARPDLVADLEPLVAGDVRFDEYTRQLYATDASAYERLPVGVVLPRSTEDVAAVVAYCAEEGIPVLPRGGGTSLAGQSVNEAVVLDCSRYMDGVREVDPDARTATAGPGVTIAHLNDAAADHGLTFGPDPAWGDKSALGGAIGNNSTGSHSLVYGKTDYYVEEVEAVLADGTVTRLGEVAVADLRAEADPEADDLLPRIYAEVVRILDEETDEVDARYPDLKRNVSGYNLDALVEDARGERPLPDGTGTDPDSEAGTVNLARLLAGSEGTLAVVTEATVSLEPAPGTKAVALLTYDSLLDAMEDVEPILEHGPCAVEVMDDTLLDLARDTPEFADVVGTLPEGTGSVLLVEFYAEDDDHGRRQVADLVADRAPGTATEADPTAGRVETRKERYAVAAMEAHDADTRARFWKMRKAGLPILLSRTSDAKHISFIEDCAVPAGNLPDYVADFQEVLDEHGTFASFYAHAGPGVLHVRPLVNTKGVEGMAQLEGIADDVTDLVVEYGGSVSGEHGDGRARTQWNRKLYGERLWRAFRDLKTAFDPDWLLNPGNVCGDHDMTEHLRFSPEYEFDAGFDPALSWEGENGFQGMVELCHGCGGCRGHQDTTGGVMCPTYRAAEEEIQSTRGRANMLRSAMNGDFDEDELLDPEFGTEVLDLCVGCKGCKVNCPSGVDLAKMKAEVQHADHEANGASLRDRVFANIDALSRVGSALAPLANRATDLPGARTVLERTLGIAADRKLPTFAAESFAEWFESRGPGVSPVEAERTVVLFPDTYTNYNRPEAGKAAVRVLEAAGVRVELAEARDSGRPAHSKGFVDRARAEVAANARALAPHVESGKDVVLVEPSDAVMFQSDALDLVGPDHDARADAETVAANAYGLCEYLDAFRLDDGVAWAGDGPVTYHGHCHQKAEKKDHHAVGVLRRAGYAVDPLDSTCCGMAGSFGYEAEHASMSTAIGDVLAGQVADSPGERVAAPGASCRSQLEEYDEEPAHPAELLADALAD
ncbi:FAD-binding and (Fe-S)-binding domain-containing protein [Halosegnis marinus]|uniref:D-lactate dehydrogenase (cytochrome) n=1 Tax=Halosegnis marinus TaxID=3034023 RepID=A0ABD5ZPU1_9EURY|nr:FAD-binding and (Fe-S)-binding domain-containing protein [Halosegnis sp. DT85]